MFVTEFFNVKTTMIEQLCNFGANVPRQHQHDDEDELLGCLPRTRRSTRCFVTSQPVAALRCFDEYDQDAKVCVFSLLEQALLDQANQ